MQPPQEESDKYQHPAVSYKQHFPRFEIPPLVFTVRSVCTVAVVYVRISFGSDWEQTEPLNLRSRTRNTDFTTTCCYSRYLVLFWSLIFVARAMTAHCECELTNGQTDVRPFRLHSSQLAGDEKASSPGLAHSIRSRNRNGSIARQPAMPTLPLGSERGSHV